MTTWETWCHDHVNGDGTVREHPAWTIVGVWEAQRSDGLRSAHKMESPYPSWRATLEHSLRLADTYLPLGAPLPAGMRTRDDPDFGPLWGRTA